MATTAERLDRLEKFMGVVFLEGEDLLAKFGTRQLSQLNDAQFATVKVPANELPNGEYNFAVYQALTNRIMADQAEEIRLLKARPSGSVSTPPPQPEPTPTGTLTAADLNGVLNQFDIYIEKDPETGRSYFSMGGPPDFDSQSPFQLGWKFAAEIGGYSNVAKTDKQNPDEPHCSTFVISDNDGGVRWRQYLKYGKKGKIRNTLNRPASILAFDSQGELCQSVEQVGQTSDGGQMWYIKFDWARKLVRFLPFKPGWLPTIEACSTNYADADIKLL